MKNNKLVSCLTIFFTIFMISTSINAIGFEDSRSMYINDQIFVSQQFNNLLTKGIEDYVIFDFTETNSFIDISGNPQLPVYIKTIELPFKSKILEINCEVSKINIDSINHKIIPAIKPQPDYNLNQEVSFVQNNNIYSKDQIYPENWFSYRVSSGLNKDTKHVTYLKIQFNPLRYNPIKNQIDYVNEISLQINYQKPATPITFADEYDFLIISFDRFKPLINPLVDHKNSHGINTKVVTLREIYNSKYFPVEGRDNPEKIKYFIKNAIENWGITYVLLLGNFKKVPIRYACLETDKGGFYEELKFASDLYYADIYNGEGEFSSWDTNQNGIYAEWPYNEGPADSLDLIPDVNIGRLACMHAFEVITMVKKIINYEETANGSDWFNRFVLCGGDTFDKAIEGGTDYNEGEEANKKAIEYMLGFEPITLWTSLDNLTGPNMHNEISAGAGFLYMVGHGNPKNWCTHYNGDYENWTDGFRNKNIMQLTNKDKYPILMVGGCHNSEIDVTPINLLIDFERAWIWTKWVPECWSWVFVKNPRGGAIASIGSSGFGGVNVGDFNSNGIPDCVEGADGWFETQFFRLYNEENLDILGETYSQVVTDYVNNFPVDSDRYDCKIVETHIFLGDPSLKIGGYE